MYKSTKTVFVTLAALTILSAVTGLSPARAGTDSSDLTPMTTLGQLAAADPHHIRLPKTALASFPAPVGSRIVHTNEVAGSGYVSVSGSLPLAAKFYPPVLDARGWTITSQLVRPGQGMFAIVACKDGTCVNMDMGNAHGGKKLDTIRLMFFKDSDK